MLQYTVSEGARTDDADGSKCSETTASTKSVQTVRAIAASYLPGQPNGTLTQAHFRTQLGVRCSWQVIGCQACASPHVRAHAPTRCTRWRQPTGGGGVRCCGERCDEMGVAAWSVRPRNASCALAHQEAFPTSRTGATAKCMRERCEGQGAGKSAIRRLWRSSLDNEHSRRCVNHLEQSRQRLVH